MMCEQCQCLTWIGGLREEGGVGFVVETDDLSGLVRDGDRADSAARIKLI